MTCLFLRLSLTNVYADFLPGSHQYLLTSATAFWGLGFIITNGVRLPSNIRLHVAYHTYFYVLCRCLLDCLGSYPQLLLWYIYHRLCQITKYGMALLLFHEWCIVFIPLGRAFRDAVFGESEISCWERQG